MNTDEASFDTLKTVQQLCDDGVDQRQAAAIVKMVAGAQQTLVTRAHFDAHMAVIELRFNGLERRIDGLKKDFDLRLSRLQAELTMKLGAMIAAGIGLLAVLIKFF